MVVFFSSHFKGNLCIPQCLEILLWIIALAKKSILLRPQINGRRRRRLRNAILSMSAASKCQSGQEKTFWSY